RKADFSHFPPVSFFWLPCRLLLGTIKTSEDTSNKHYARYSVHAAFWCQVLPSSFRRIGGPDGREKSKTLRAVFIAGSARHSRRARQHRRGARPGHHDAGQRDDSRGAANAEGSGKRVVRE